MFFILAKSGDFGYIYTCKRSITQNLLKTTAYRSIRRPADCACGSYVMNCVERTNTCFLFNFAAQTIGTYRLRKKNTREDAGRRKKNVLDNIIIVSQTSGGQREFDTKRTFKNLTIFI